MTGEWKGCGRKWSWPVSRHCCSVPEMTGKYGSYLVILFLHPVSLLFLFCLSSKSV
jgi:hypothetical protein